MKSLSTTNDYSLNSYNIEQYFPVVLVKVILNFVSVDEIFKYHYSPKSY